MRFIFMLLAIFVTALGAVATEVPNSMKPLLANRNSISRAFANKAGECFQRRDTSHDAFHGCIDWHSAVHAAWALTAYTRATNDRSYIRLLESTLTPAALQRETDLLLSDRGFEMPYGRSWLLRLAIEHKQTFDSDLLTPLASVAFESMVKYYRDNPPDPFSRDYQSASWALINMLDYARLTGDQQSERLLTKMVSNNFVNYAGKCRYQSELQGFMAICTNWAWLVSKILPRSEFSSWQVRFFADGIPEPIQTPSTAHEAGLNFSRAWGLWSLFEATDDTKFLDAYAAHFTVNYERRENWDGPYDTVGHWVPQFGMFAIAPLLDKSSRK